MKRWKKTASEPCCGSCSRFVRHFVPLRGPKDKRFIKCSCGHCACHPEKGCYADNTAPCKEYQPGCEPVTLRLKRHAFQR